MKLYSYKYNGIDLNFHYMKLLNLRGGKSKKKLKNIGNNKEIIIEMHEGRMIWQNGIQRFLFEIFDKYEMEIILKQANWKRDE